MPSPWYTISAVKKNCMQYFTCARADWDIRPVLHHPVCLSVHFVELARLNSQHTPSWEHSCFRKALYAMNIGYSSKNCKYPLSKLTDVLHLNTDTHTQNVCQELGLSILGEHVQFLKGSWKADTKVGIFAIILTLDCKFSFVCMIFWWVRIGPVQCLTVVPVIVNVWPQINRT